MLLAALVLLLTVVALGPFVALGAWMILDAQRLGLDLRLFPPRDERGLIIPRDAVDRSDRPDG